MELPSFSPFTETNIKLKVRFGIKDIEVGKGLLNINEQFNNFSCIKFDSEIINFLISYQNIVIFAYKINIPYSELLIQLSSKFSSNLADLLREKGIKIPKRKEDIYLEEDEEYSLSLVFNFQFKETCIFHLGTKAYQVLDSGNLLNSHPDSEDEDSKKSL